MKYKIWVTSLLKVPEISTYLHSVLQSDMTAHAGRSGFYILDTGDKSLRARLAMINSAERSLDLQYYAINDDLTSNLLIEAIIKAAERGVAVRFLIDDISIGKIRKSLSILNTIDNIDIRIFNPITTFGQSFLSRMIGFFLHLPRTTKRMHNKVLVADDIAAITGGRNLGDEYFDAHAELAFKDIDILAAGPVAQDIADNFSHFWNDKHSFPIEKLYSIRNSQRAIRKFRIKLAKSRKKEFEDSGDQKDFLIRLEDFLKKSGANLIWSDCEFLGDMPDNIRPETAAETKPTRKIFPLIEQAEREILLISPYFVPRETGVKWISGFRRRNISVRVITNSLASTDVVAVHTGYRQYRPALLQQGVELYELKPRDGKRIRQRIIGRKSPSYASLHAKVYVIDQKTAIIGSLNLDPRSVNLNTEVALVIYDGRIARQLHALSDAVIDPKSSYRVSLGQGQLAWHTEHKGKRITLHHEPNASIWRRVQTVLIGLLPVEDQL